MKAKLATRCGCSREIEVPYPPNPVLVLPLHCSGEYGESFEKCMPTTPTNSLHVRRFKLQDNLGRGPYGPTDTAYYAEE